MWDGSQNGEGNVATVSVLSSCLSKLRLDAMHSQGGLRVNIFKETTTDGNVGSYYPYVNSVHYHSFLQTEMAGPVVIDSEVEGSPKKQAYELTS